MLTAQLHGWAQLRSYAVALGEGNNPTLSGHRLHPAPPLAGARGRVQARPERRWTCGPAAIDNHQ
jgi:hypothetical protein